MNREEKTRLFMSRFFGRQDVYGRKKESVSDDGQIKARYSPVCANFWSDGCHIKNRTGKNCDTCEIKHYEPVSAEVVSRHIKGEEQHIYYVLQNDGTIKFGAVDFDLKPGKEEKGYTFELIKPFLNLLDELQIPYGVARSTTMGFHVYFFMEDFYPANRFRAIILELFERVEYAEWNRLGHKTLPEIFPKQAYNSLGGIGNGIKPPMIIPSFLKERNGWVTKDNEWIGSGLELGPMAEAQWEYFNSIPKVSSALLDEIIEREQIRIWDDFKVAGESQAGRPAPAYRGGSRGPRLTPITGSIEKVLEGCASLRKLRDRCLKGEVPSHDEGFGLYHICLGTPDGKDWFLKNVPGWGKTDSDLKQLEHSEDKNYSPWTCRKLQERGICPAGTKCFEKKPRAEMVEGQIVYRTDEPEERWPEPSPIRYSFGKGEDFMAKLMEEARAAKDLEAGAKLEFLKNIAQRVMVFDEAQIKEFKQFLSKEKIAKAKEYATYFREAHLAAVEAVKKRAAEYPNTVTVDEDLFTRGEHHGYYIKKINHKDSKHVKISDIDIEIQEVRTYLDDGRVTASKYYGRLKGRGFEIPFEIDSTRFDNNNEFMDFFGALAPLRFNLHRANIDSVRRAAKAFAERAGVPQKVILVTQGWYDDTYLMPSVVVDKDGIRPNDTREVDLTGKEYAKFLDFKYLPEDEVRDLLQHILVDLLNAWPRRWTMMGIAHTLLPAILPKLGPGFDKKPVLFYEGMTGSGKTELTHVLQCFWGAYPKVLNLMSSAKGVMDVSNDFKDSLLVIDDFKGMSNEQIKAVESAIQYGYDGHFSVKMTRDSKQAKHKESRGLFMVSGEQFINHEASAVSRAILVQVFKRDITSTKPLYDQCLENRYNYSAVTAQFLHWFLNQDIDVVKRRYKDIFDRLHGEICDKQNASRLSYNLGTNHLVWGLFVEFMLYHNVISPADAADLVKEHYLHAEEILVDMVARCEEEQNGWVFARVLRQLLESGEVSIKGLSGFEHKYKQVIGFHRKRTPMNHICFYPDLVWEVVCKHTPIRGTRHSIGQQLRSEGAIVDVTNDSPHSTQKKVRGPDGNIRGMWVIDLDKIGVNWERDGGSSGFVESPPGEQLLDGVI